jgi:hypothetical protein
MSSNRVVRPAYRATAKELLIFLPRSISIFRTVVVPLPIESAWPVPNKPLVKALEERLLAKR